MRKSILLFYLLILLGTLGFAGNVDTSKVKFEGKVLSIKYTLNREIDEVPFTITNKSKEEITVKLQGGYLVRGKNYDPLEKVSFKTYVKNNYKKVDEFTVKPGKKASMMLIFKPFTLYTGSQYAVMSVILVDGQKMSAITKLELSKLEQIDKNKMNKPNH